jgi:hypothetical protein
MFFCCCLDGFLIQVSYLKIFLTEVSWVLQGVKKQHFFIYVFCPQSPHLTPEARTPNGELVRLLEGKKHQAGTRDVEGTFSW